MRFLKQSADIPDRLIRAVSDGDAIFLCGAGISMRAKMPSFKSLTNKIYKELGETWKNEPAEKTAYKRKEFDRVLRALEKRTKFPKAPSPVRDATAKFLKTPKHPKIQDHKSIIDLSRDSEGRTRILTTNFDTLFEHAAQSPTSNSLPSHAGKGIPKPGGPNDFGIMHLHGRIDDSKLALSSTDLILTSADFGDAYLRDGWASQYIEDRMRLNTLVLVGYGAEDAALRLLLETLDADRERFADLNDIYALEIQNSEMAAIWRAKGIIPIEFPDYDAIYLTLNEWAKYNLAPAQYARSRIQSILTV